MSGDRSLRGSGTALRLAMQFAPIWEAVADVSGDHPAVVQGDRSVPWRTYEDRAARLAAALVGAGLGQDSKVGMYLYNSPEYCETNFAAMKLGGIPVNVNYRYLDDELRYLLEDADVEAVVFHSSLGERIARVARSLPKVRLLVEVDDVQALGSAGQVPGALGYEDVVAANEPLPRRTPDGSETYMLYTGGTTGMPKGVVYSTETFTSFLVQGNASLVGLPAIESADQLVASVAATDPAHRVTAMSGPPLMHGTGCWIGMMLPHLFGGTACLLESRHLDPAEVWTAIERNGVQRLVIVGDAFARPLARALDAEPGRWDLSSLQLVISSGAMFSTEVKQQLFAHLPHLAIADVLGSTEGGMAQSVSTGATPVGETARFGLLPAAKVFTDDNREVVPGSGEVGMLASGGLVPLAYYKDPEKSARTFRQIGGVRYSFPGDMARVAADGTIELLGRGSGCINTGGEKVFPEEVEEALMQHPAVDDALVFGVPDERFGSRVVGVVSLAPGGSATTDELIAHTRLRLSSFKVPRQLQVVDQVPRAPNGKADYRGARALFDAAPA